MKYSITERAWTKRRELWEKKCVENNTIATHFVIEKKNYAVIEWNAGTLAGDRIQPEKIAPFIPEPFKWEMQRLLHDFGHKKYWIVGLEGKVDRIPLSYASKLVEAVEEVLKHLEKHLEWQVLGAPGLRWDFIKIPESNYD